MSGAEALRAPCGDRWLVVIAVGAFQPVLARMAHDYGACVLPVAEPYTSQSCAVCDALAPPSGRDAACTKGCGTDMDRDVRGACGVLRRALTFGALAYHALAGGAEE